MVGRDAQRNGCESIGIVRQISMTMKTAATCCGGCGRCRRSVSLADMAFSLRNENHWMIV